MAFSLDVVQENILSYMRSEFVQPIVEQSIPGPETVLRNDAGLIEPYIAIQFGDIQPFARGKSFAGPRGDDYWLPLYCQSLAPTPEIARRLSNKLVNVMLGMNFDWAGSVRKRSGYGMFPIDSSTGGTEAYEFPTFFQIAIQISNEA